EEPSGFRPILIGGQRVEVVEAVRDHQAAHAALPVEARQGVGVVDQAGCAPQRPPEFIHDAEELSPRRESLLGEDGGGVHYAEGVGPDTQHGRGDELVPGGGDVRDVHRYCRGVQVDWGGGRVVEDSFQAAFAQQGEGGDQFVDAALVVRFAGGAG